MAFPRYFVEHGGTVHIDGQNLPTYMVLKSTTNLTTRYFRSQKVMADRIMTYKEAKELAELLCESLFLNAGKWEVRYKEEVFTFNTHQEAIAYIKSVKL